MALEKSAAILDINRKRHELPVSVILFNMVDYSKINNLPLNQDCTEILNTAVERALERMFMGARCYVETFMPRRQEFQSLLAEEIDDFSKNGWSLQQKIQKTASQNDNSAILTR